MQNHEFRINSRVSFLKVFGKIIAVKGVTHMALTKNDELDEILKKLEAAEKEYEEKLRTTELTQIIKKEELLRKEVNNLLKETEMFPFLLTLIICSGIL